MTKGKPILSLDFDGVIHSYKSGWQGADVIPDVPVIDPETGKSAIEWLYELIEEFEVHIFSSRSNSPEGIVAMQRWVWTYELSWLRSRKDDSPLRLVEALHWPTQKPPAFITIDDRAVTFTGAFIPPKDLLAFKPWYHTPTKE